MKQVLVDSSVVLDLFTRDPVFFASSKNTLIVWGSTHLLTINPVIYSEVSVGFGTIESLQEALEGAGFGVAPIPREALFLAGKVFVAYRRRSGSRTSPGSRGEGRSWSTSSAKCLPGKCSISPS